MSEGLPQHLQDAQLSREEQGVGLEALPGSLLELAALAAGYRDSIDAHDKEQKRLESELAKIESKLVDMMLVDGIDNVRIAGIGTLYLNKSLIPIVDKAHKEAMLLWFKGSREYNGCVKEDVPFMTLQKVCRELAALGRTPPPGVEVRPRNSLGFRRAR